MFRFLQISFACMNVANTAVLKTKTKELPAYMKLDDPNALSKLPVQLPIALVQARLRGDGDDKPAAADAEPKKEEKATSEDKDSDKGDSGDESEKDKKEPSDKTKAPPAPI